MKYSYVLNSSTGFKDLVEALGNWGVGFLAVINQEGELVGVVTDGDVRRAVLNDNEDLDSVLNKSPFTMNRNSSRAEVLFKLKKLRRRHMPLVDDNFKLVSVFALDDVDFYQRENTVVIMAGGLGTRLGELTQEIPKPMVAVAGKPMLLHVVESLREQGFYRFKFCVNYKKEKIKKFFKKGTHLGVEIDYIEENQRLGTAGALSLIEDAPSEPFIVMNADVMTSLNFGELIEHHVNSKSTATMCLRKYEETIPFGVVDTDLNGVITSLREKPKYSFKVNAGVYVLNSDVFSFIPKDTFFDMPTLFESIMKRGGSCHTYDVLGYWMDLGRKEDLAKAEKDMSFDEGLN